jgi:hypothetical protein
MVGQHHHVRLEVPADSHFLSVTRRAVSAVGALAGLGRAGLDDLQLAVDEQCCSLLEESSEGPLELDCDVARGVVAVTGRVRAAAQRNVDRARRTLSARILDATCNAHHLRVDRGIAEFRVVKRAPGVRLAPA